MWQQLITLGVGIGLGIYLFLTNRQQEEHYQAGSNSSNPGHLPYDNDNNQPNPQQLIIRCNLCNEVIENVGGALVCGHNFHLPCVNDHQQQMSNSCPVSSCAEPFQAIFEFQN